MSKTSSRTLLQGYINRLLPGIEKRGLPPLTTKTRKAANIFRTQYIERNMPVVALLTRTMREHLGKADILDSMRFFTETATFYHLELLVTDIARYRRHLARWKSYRRSKLANPIE